MDREVIIVLHSLAIGGAERRVSSLANYMSSKGIKVHILLIDSPEVSFELSSDVEIVCVNQNINGIGYDLNKCSVFRISRNCRTTMMENAKLLFLKKTNRFEASVFEIELYLKYMCSEALMQYIEKYPEAIVVSFMTIPNIAMTMAIKNLPNRCVITDCTSAEFEYPADSPYCKLRRKYYPYAQAAMFQTPDERDYYTFLPNVRKYVIPNFIRSEHLPARFEGSRRHDIVNFCRLSPVKNIPLLIEAFALFHAKFSDYTLSIYGEGDIKADLLKYIEAKGLQNSVHIYDFDINIHAKISDAAMFVSSSDREGISNSMLEALAIGMPCVCTDCPAGGARMMIEDHENGLLVPIKDANALYLAMKELADNPELAEHVSKNAVKIKERLKPEKICDEMIEAIFGEKG